VSYRVVLLDVGGTLVGPRVSFGTVYAEAAAALGLELDPGGVDRHIRDVWDEMNRQVPPGTNRYAHYPDGEEEYWLRFSRQTLERATSSALSDELARLALARIREAFADPGSWTVFADVRPTLERLVTQGTRLAVVSNWDSRLPWVLRMLDLARFFDDVGVSCFEGVEKPNPDIFFRVLARLGERPGDALHVGDVPEIDLAGARAAGIDGLLIDRHGRHDGRAHVLRDLTPLPAIARGEPGDSTEPGKRTG